MTSSNGNIFRITGLLCGEFTGHRWIPRKKPVSQSFDVFFDLRLNKRLSKQSRGWWYETPSCSLWRHCYSLKPAVEKDWICKQWADVLTFKWFFYLRRVYLKYIQAKAQNWIKWNYSRRVCIESVIFTSLRIKSHFNSSKASDWMGYTECFRHFDYHFHRYSVLEMDPTVIIFLGRTGLPITLCLPTKSPLSIVLSYYGGSIRSFATHVRGISDQWFSQVKHTLKGESGSRLDKMRNRNT